MRDIVAKIYLYFWSNIEKALEWRKDWAHAE